MIAAVSLDFWDTLYLGGPSPERLRRSHGALRALVEAAGALVDDAALERAHRAAGHEFERRWREESRGYTTEDRVRWTLGHLGVDRPAGCAHVAAATAAVDDVLVSVPVPLLPGARALVERLARRGVALAITSDTGFASGRAQDRLLAADDLLGRFAARIYSCDVGHAKPHPAMFAELARRLAVAPGSIVHVGDLERTDVAGALAAGMRAVRLDAVRDSGPSAAEHVATSLDALGDYLESAIVAGN